MLGLIVKYESADETISLSLSLSLSLSDNFSSLDTLNFYIIKKIHVLFITLFLIYTLENGLLSEMWYRTR